MLFNHALNSSPVCPMACHSTSRQAFECNLDSRSIPDGELAFFHGLRRSIHIEHSNNYVGSEGRTIDYRPGRTRIIPWPACFDRLGMERRSEERRAWEPFESTRPPPNSLNSSA